MGPEAYGLVGFFTMLQAWFNLLDLGMSPTLAREASILRGGASNILDHLKLLRAMQVIFTAIAIIGGGALYSGSAFIAADWLKTSQLPLNMVQGCIELIALCVALRWISGLYRAYITGAERLVWLGLWNSFIATLRFLGVLPFLIYYDNSTLLFFQYQFFVAIIELIGLVVMTKKLVPSIPIGSEVGWNLMALLKSTSTILRFSIGVAFTSSVWVLITQLDKLLLSKLLPLSEYGYFTLAVLAASGVMMLAGPITNAVMPRITYMQAKGDAIGAINLYRLVTQIVSIVVIPATLMLGFFPYEILLIWTGDSIAAKSAYKVLALYAFGNGFLVVGSLPLLLQYAKGDIRLHVIGNLGYVLILIPLLIYGTIKFGLIGAGWAWLGANAFSFLVWTAVVHKKFMPGLHLRWIVQDVSVICLFALVGVAFVKIFIYWPQERIDALICLVGSSASLLVFSSLGSSHLRNKFYLILKKN